MNKLDLSDAEWRERLTPERYHVLREAGTERAFAGDLNLNKDTSAYHCAGCGTILFDSSKKYDSGSGWPSFTEPVNDQAVIEYRDTSHGTVRTEVRCAVCDGHLGHVFNDGPAENGLRYCMNSLALEFEDKETS